MGKKVFENKYIEFVWEEQYRILKFTWKDTLGLLDIGFKEICQAQTEYIKLYLPQSVLINHENFAFPIDPELQEWINDYCLSDWKKSQVKNIALTITKEIIAQLSIEQVWEEPIGQRFDVRYFDCSQDAQQWLYKIKEMV